jgi:NADH:ubiquinone oxidoreductase subunit 4 (subunit M)
MPDLNAREWAATLPLVLLMFWMGIYSQSFMPAISTQNAQILQRVNGTAAALQTPAVREVANAR